MSQSGGGVGWTDYWNSPLRDSWVQEQTRLDALFEPLSKAVLARAAPRPGEHVIDVGCGCGATTLDLARAVV
jgi:cyclopropane fatty-acyl-phospholipid synthase-like methyltransferase